MEDTITKYIGDILISLHQQVPKDGKQRLETKCPLDAKLCVLLCENLNRWYVSDAWKLSIVTNNPRLLVRTMDNWMKEMSPERLIQAISSILHDITIGWYEENNKTRAPGAFFQLYKKRTESIQREDEILNAIITIVQTIRSKVVVAEVLPFALENTMCLMVKNRALFEDLFWKIKNIYPQK